MSTENTLYPETTLGKRLSDSVGYLFVVFLCALAGYSLSSSGDVSVSITIIVLCYVFLLAAYFYSREAILERRNPEHSNTLLSEGLQLPLIFFVLISPLTVLILYAYFDNNPQHTFEPWWEAVLALSIAVAPFILLWLNSYVLVKKDKYQEAYSFQNKVLFPAIYTCLLPFSFGWSLHGNQIDILFLSLVAILVTASKIVAIVFKTQMSYLILSIFLLLAISIFGMSFIDIEILKPLLYGVIITLSLGVSETQKRVYLANIKDSYQPSDEGLSFLFAGANWSSIVFPLFLALIPLMSDDLTLWPFLIFIFIQIVHWFNVDKPVISRKKYWESMLIGFSLFIVLIFVSNSNLEPTLVKQESLNTLGLIFAICLTIGITLTRQLPDGFCKISFNNNLYISKPKRYVFFVWSLLTLDMLSIFIASFAEMFFVDSIIIKQKVTEIILFSFFIFGVVSFQFFNSNRWRRPDNNKNPENNDSKEDVNSSSDGSKENGTLNNTSKSQMILQLLITGRIYTSVIPGIAVMTLSYFPVNGSFENSLIAGFIFTLITMFGFLVNDILDYDKDVVARIDRPIATGKLSRIHAILSALFLSFFVVGISLIVNNEDAFFVVLVTLFLLVMYSHISRLMPIAKGVVTAILCLTPIWYVVKVSSIEISSLFYISIFVYIFGRELFMDGMDYSGDRKSGLKTLPAYLGVVTSKRLGWLFMVIGTVIYALAEIDGISLVLTLPPVIIMALSAFYTKNNDELGVRITRGILLVYASTLPFVV